MTAAEMNLDHLNQICRLQADELETKDSQIRRIREIFDEREQRLEDECNLNCACSTWLAACFKLKELRSLRKDMDSILGQEE